MPDYKALTKDELRQEQKELMEAYRNYQAMGLTLDMSRGKPGTD